MTDILIWVKKENVPLTQEAETFTDALNALKAQGRMKLNSQLVVVDMEGDDCT